MIVGCRTWGNTFSFMFKHVGRTKPADAFRCLDQIVNTYNSITIGIRISYWYYLVSTLIKNSKLWKIWIYWESERTLKAEVVSVETFWCVLVSIEVSIGKSIAHIIKEVIWSHSEGSVVISPYLGSIFNFEYSKFSIGGREAPIAWILNKRKRIIDGNR